MIPWVWRRQDVMSEETLCHKDFNWLFLLSKYDELRLGNFLRLYASHLHVFSFHFKLSILTIIDLCLKQIISRILSSFFLLGGGGLFYNFTNVLRQNVLFMTNLIIHLCYFVFLRCMICFACTVVFILHFPSFLIIMLIVLLKH